MELINYFYIDENSCLGLNTHKIVVKHYVDGEMAEFEEKTYYLNETDYAEWTTQLIPKHKMIELSSEEVIYTSEYAWMEGIRLLTDNFAKEIEEIAACGSLEAYQASLPESRDEFEVETDYRLSMLELGLGGGIQNE